MKSRILCLVAVDVGRALEGGEAVGPEPVRAAPAYPEVLPGHRLLASEEARVQDRPVNFRVKFYHPSTVVAEAGAEAGDLFDLSVLKFKRELLDRCHGLARNYAPPGALAEEYALYCASDDPGTLSEARKARIVGLLHAETEEMAPDVVATTLAAASLRYGADDLAVVGWDGAVVFSDEREFQEIAEILTLANIQLLKLRVLDAEVEAAMAGLRGGRGQGRWLRSRRAWQDILRLRTGFLLEFEAIRRDIDLFGDWYTAKLYALASRRLHLDEKTQEVKERLGTLEDLHEMASQRASNFYMLVLEAAIVALLLFEVGRALLPR
ncbi:MAG: hypothetical protein QXO51_00525 [Halobacteria archaeon]